MKYTLFLASLFLFGCAHNAKRAPSSSEDQKARSQVEGVLRSIADNKFDIDGENNALQMMLIYKPATKSSGIAYVGEVYLPSRDVFCNTNFFMYEANGKDGESCTFQLVCPKLFPEYRKRAACPML